MKELPKELAEMVREAYRAGFTAACKWRGPVTQDADSPAYNREFNAWSFSVREKHAAILDTEGDGGAVLFAYGSEDGRVIPKATRDVALRDGGASKSATDIYTIPLYTHPARSGVVSDEDVRDAKFFRWHYSKECRTESNALVDIEIRIINGDWPTINEVRTAYESAIQGERHER